MKNIILKARNKTIFLLNNFLSLILPPTCYACGKLVVSNKSLCGECWKDVHFISGCCCKKCGYPMRLEDDDEVICCLECSISDPLFDRVISCCEYSGTARSLVTMLKYSDQTHLAKYMAQVVFSAIGSVFGEIDIICPAPMHRDSLLLKTYNHSALIAKELSRLFQKNRAIIFVPDLLVKKRKTRKQAGVTQRNLRLANVKNSIALKKEYLSLIFDKKILIVDDVFTTGATMIECSRAIKDSASVSGVYGVTFARTLLMN